MDGVTPDYALPFMYIDETTGDAYINTTLADGEIEYNVTETVTVNTDGGNTASFTIEVSIGCYDIANVSVSIVYSDLIPEFTMLTSSQTNPYDFKIVLHQLDVGQSLQTYTIPLSDAGITFPTSLSYCNASFIGLCELSDCSESAPPTTLINLDPLTNYRSGELFPDPVMTIDVD